MTVSLRERQGRDRMLDAFQAVRLPATVYVAYDGRKHVVLANAFRTLDAAKRAVEGLAGERQQWSRGGEHGRSWCGGDYEVLQLEMER